MGLLVAESIIVHFRYASIDKAASAADKVAVRGQPGSTLCRYPADEDAYTLTIYPYDDLQGEAEPAELDELRAMLGGELPASSMVIELRRSRGDRACADAEEVVRGLLEAEVGIVDDTYENLWTATDIEGGALKGGRRFLDAYRRRGRPRAFIERAAERSPPNASFGYDDERSEERPNGPFASREPLGETASSTTPPTQPTSPTPSGTSDLVRVSGGIPQVGRRPTRQAGGASG